MAFQLDNIERGTTKSKNNEKEGSTPLLEREIKLFKNGFSNRAKEDFYTEIGVLLKAGISLTEALELISGSQKKKNKKTILDRLIKDIVSGENLSSAIKRHRDFSDYEYYSLKIGEETGTSSKIAQQLGEFYHKKNEQRKNLINALTYPCIILTTAMLVVIFMLQFVVPMFEDIFKQQNAELPGMTKFIIGTSDFLESNGPILIGLFVLIITLTIYLGKKQWFKKEKDNVVSRIPFVGEFVKIVYMSQFTQAVALLTSSKVPLVRSIDLVKHMVPYYPLKSALEQVEEDLLRGENLSSSLAKQKLFDPKMVALIKVAEETNQTEFIFERLNQQYTSRVEQRSKLLSTVIEPIIIMIVGVFVGFILLAMYLPMFRLSSVLG